MKIDTYTAKDAIERSISYNEIVHILALGTVQAELVAACEDWVDTGEEDKNGRIYEYWGTNKDGEEWRVHVHGATGH